jgi:hypothetical protein
MTFLVSIYNFNASHKEIEKDHHDYTERFMKYSLSHSFSYTFPELTIFKGKFNSAQHKLL